MSLISCSVRRCQLKKKNNAFGIYLQFFMFPRDPNLKTAWIKACGRNPENFNAENAYVCSLHFENSSYKDNLKMVLKESVVPTKFLFWKKNTNLESITLTTRQENNRKRKAETDPVSLNKILHLQPAAPSSSKTTCSNIIIWPKKNKGVKPLIYSNIKAIKSNLISTIKTDSQNSVRSDHVHTDKSSKLQESSVSSEPPLNPIKIGHNFASSGRQLNKNLTGQITLNHKINSFETIINCNCVELKKQREINEKLKKELQEEKQKTDKLSNETNKLRNSLISLIVENQNLKRQPEVNGNDIHIAQYLSNILSRLFTSAQMKLLVQPKCKNINWSPEDFESALALKNISLEAYQHLQETVGIPLPSLKVLEQWELQVLHKINDHSNTYSFINKNPTRSIKD